MKIVLKYSSAAGGRGNSCGSVALATIRPEPGRAQVRGLTHAFQRGLPSPIRQIALPDGTAALSLPAGLSIVPNRSGVGITTVTGPQGKLLGLNMYYLDQYSYSHAHPPSIYNCSAKGAFLITNH